MIQLRTYQHTPYEAGIGFFQQPSSDPSILVAPTAFGKSVLIAALASKIEGRSLVIQPSKELLVQNFEKFTLMGGRAAIYSASAGEKKFGNVMYATIGSIKNLGQKFAALGFTNLIIDEVHLYPRGVESMLGSFLATSGIKKVLGLTATPFKLQSNLDQNGERYSKLQMMTSKSAVGQKDKVARSFFKDIIHVTQIQELTSMGFWSPLEYELHPFSDKGLEYNSAKSDYTEESLFQNFEEQNIEHKILHRLRSLDRKAVLIFVPTKKDAIRLSELVPNSAAIYSGMPNEEKERERIVRQFKAGIIRYVFNVNILATGFDHTKIDCIIFGRRTGSLAWFYQAAGRGTRIDAEKENCLIIDFVGNVDRFGRLEHIYFKRKKSWQCYGEGGRLLSNIALHQIGQVFDSPVSGVKMPFGKHKDKDISTVPRDYLDWLINNKDFTWTDRNRYIKEAAEQILDIKTA